MAKDKRYFCLIEIGFIAKKENELQLFHSIYSIFYLIPKIYFKKYGWGVAVRIIFFHFLCLLLLSLLSFNLMIVIIVILLLSLLFFVMSFLCLLYF